MRHYGFDWLRAAVIFLLFPFHTARVFDVWEPNYVKGVINGFSTWFVAALSIWIMPLLFVIAGYSSYAALSKRTPKQYMKERVLRLLVPLMFGLVLIAPPQGFMARLEGGYTGHYLQFLGGYFTDFSDLSGYTGSFSPDHLWFILYLFVVSAAMLPLLVRMRRRPEWFAWAQKPWIIVLGFIPVTLMEALPDIGGKNIFFFAMLFLLGAVFATSGAFLHTLRRCKWTLIAGGVAASVVYLLIVSQIGWPDGWNAVSIGLGFLQSFAMWLTALGLIGLADAFLNKPSRALGYLSRASYPVYLVHQTLLIVIAYFVVRSGLAPAPQYITIMLGSLATSLAFYEVFRRFRPTRFMLGIK